MRPSELSAHIRKLSPAERVALVDEIWESLRADPAVLPVTEAQRDELDRRIDASASGRSVTTPWPVVLDRLRSGR